MNNIVLKNIFKKESKAKVYQAISTLKNVSILALLDYP